MKSDYISAIIKSLDHKIMHLKRFEEITEKIIKSDFEDLAEHIAQRQLVIADVDKHTLKIKKLIAEQPDEVQITINKILSFTKTNQGERYEALQEKASELENVLVEISEKEKFARNRMDELKKELDSEMQKSSKSRQVIDYVNNFTVVTSNGKTFDSIT